MGFVSNLFSNPIAGLMVQGAGVGISTAAARQQAEADNMARQWNATMARQKAQLSLVQADDARKRGDVEAGLRRLEGTKLKGEQRAAYAASGVDVNYGSAAKVQADTMAWAEYAAQTEITNYGREAWAHEQEARMQEFEAQRQLSGAANVGLATATAAIGGLTGMYDRYSGWRK